MGQTTAKPVDIFRGNRPREEISAMARMSQINDKAKNGIRNFICYNTVRSRCGRLDSHRYCFSASARPCGVMVKRTTPTQNIIGSNHIFTISFCFCTFSVRILLSIGPSIASSIGPSVGSPISPVIDRFFHWFPDRFPDRFQIGTYRSVLLPVPSPVHLR